MLTFTCRMLFQIATSVVKPLPNKSPIIVPFRCLPIDIDIFMHMNNAMYFRYSELARWRMTRQAGFMSKKALNWMFLAVEQDIKYIKPINCFQKFIIATEVSVDDKWLIYNHKFQQHPDDILAGKPPVLFAEINVKAVIKERSGKTVRILENEDIAAEFLHTILKQKE